MTESTISAIVKLHCIERELRHRYRLFPRLVESGTMTKAKADMEIRIMEEIAADLRAAAEKERLL
jgi:hypothetical protein